MKVKCEKINNIKDIVERFRDYSIVEVCNEKTLRPILVYEVT
ncbi:hypothetical protein [Saccharolobus sp. A20]|nr:hypothetical protein [Sulfolobus sp. A20]